MADAFECSIKGEYLLNENSQVSGNADTFQNNLKRKRSKSNIKICSYVVKELPCPYLNSCKYSHDLSHYLDNEETIDINDHCPIETSYKKCPFGFTCLYHKNHTEKPAEESLHALSGIKNSISHELETQLRKRTYDFSYSDKNLPENSQDTEPKKLLDFKGKLILAPLTTVGNLPFRRLCKTFGADVTISEMAVATNLLQGQPSEWALLKRHPTEDIFGIQLAGAKKETLCKAVELVKNYCEVDFIDLNCGCPIDLICHQGMGSALLERKSRLIDIVKSMTVLSGEIPITVKIRTGLQEGKLVGEFIASNLGLNSKSVNALTIHGRTRVQRYTKEADWSYIDIVSKVAEPLALQTIGNGDIFTYQDYQRLSSSATAVMIGRGALVKPWIFTEIKESRDWDISSTERFDLMKSYAKYAIEYFGSDKIGLSKSRKFFLEWHSFAHRYVPIGIMEDPSKAKLNQRVSRFYGRNELEALMGSPLIDNWMQLAERVFGFPAASDFEFNPRHKSGGAYEKA